MATWFTHMRFQSCQLFVHTLDSITIQTYLMISQTQGSSCVKFYLCIHTACSKIFSLFFGMMVRFYPVLIIMMWICDILSDLFYFQCFCMFQAQIWLFMNELMCFACLWAIPSPYMHDFLEKFHLNGDDPCELGSHKLAKVKKKEKTFLHQRIFVATWTNYRWHWWSACFSSCQSVEVETGVVWSLMVVWYSTIFSVWLTGLVAKRHIKTVTWHFTLENLLWIFIPLQGWLVWIILFRWFEPCTIHYV